MADNEKMMNESSARQESSQDYRERVRSQQEAKQTGSGVRSERDLGTVGGGNIPGSEMGKGSDNNPDGGTISDRHVPSHDEATSNAIDKHARGNIGGRNPSQSPTSMGDRDPKRDRTDGSDTGITDPMTSRDPSKINRKTPDNTDAQEKK